MTVTTIKVSIEGYGIWGGMEAEINPAENPIDEWIKLKELVQLAMNQSDSMKGTVVTQVDRTPKEQAIDNHIEAINGCTSLKSLEIFQKMVDRENNDLLTDAYNHKRHLLSGQ
jgi:hypothetical protein